jgi:hypothetical protein
MSRSDSARPYRMTISLNVLNHLGIGLYSNIPAVLSEVVANAWDADAKTVEIAIDAVKDEIRIVDDGSGMGLSDINDKYLTVGYQKRANEKTVTSKGRHVMGRKGIGKLSVFSIAGIIEVHSVKGREVNGLRMSRSKIEELIKDGKSHEYRPDPVDRAEIKIKKGTTIILRNLTKGLTRTETFLRTRLARRFSVIGPAYDFAVEVNGTPITSADRDYYDKVEFIWYFGKEGKAFADLCVKKRKAMKVNDLVDAPKQYRVSGWIGTVFAPSMIDDQNNTIVVNAHGKLIQEDILKDFNEGGVYTKYIIGDIDADFMDRDDLEDIVTSDRQRVKEVDPRYALLKSHVHQILRKIKSEWTDLRNDVGTKEATQNPVIKEWFEGLEGDNRKYAEKLFGRLNSLPVGDDATKKELYRNSLLAFENLALKQTLSTLDLVESEHDFAILNKVFESIDALEAVHYYQIVKGRVAVLKEFESILPDSKERVLQTYIFDHLWLLSPTWERASSNKRIEEAVTKEFEAIGKKLTAAERKGRMDIRYRTAAGKHIIIELKKYARKVTAVELYEQLEKYRSALEKCLTSKFQEHHPHIEMIAIIGSDPPGDRERNENMLAALNARWVTYDRLISETQESYADYLDRERKVAKLVSLLERI